MMAKRLGISFNWENTINTVTEDIEVTLKTKYTKLYSESNSVL